MKSLYIIAISLFLGCLIDARIDWDNNTKRERNLAYTHPHDGNLTKAEIQNNPTKEHSNSGNELYRIKGQNENGGKLPDNCISGISKCLGNCNINNNVNSSIFALKVVMIRAKRAICYDECYNEVSPGCQYPLKRIQY